MLTHQEGVRCDAAPWVKGPALAHALACDRCKGDTCAPGAGQGLEPALQHLASDPDAHVRAMAAGLVGKFVHTDGRAVSALKTARAQDPSPTVRKKAGWFTPGGTIYKRTVPRVPRQRSAGIMSVCLILVSLRRDGSGLR